MSASARARIRASAASSRPLRPSLPYTFSCAVVLTRRSPARHGGRPSCSALRDGVVEFGGDRRRLEAASSASSAVSLCRGVADPLGRGLGGDEQFVVADRDTQLGESLGGSCHSGLSGLQTSPLNRCPRCPLGHGRRGDISGRTQRHRMPTRPRGAQPIAASSRRVPPRRHRAGRRDSSVAQLDQARPKGLLCRPRRAGPRDRPVDRSRAVANSRRRWSSSRAAATSTTPASSSTCASDLPRRVELLAGMRRRARRGSTRTVSTPGSSMSVGAVALVVHTASGRDARRPRRRHVTSTAAGASTSIGRMPTRPAAAATSTAADAASMTRMDSSVSVIRASSPFTSTSCRSAASILAIRAASRSASSRRPIWSTGWRAASTRGLSGLDSDRRAPRPPPPRPCGRRARRLRSAAALRGPPHSSSPMRGESASRSALIRGALVECCDRRCVRGLGGVGERPGLVEPLGT